MGWMRRIAGPVMLVVLLAVALGTVGCKTTQYAREHDESPYEPDPDHDPDPGPGPHPPT